MIGSNPRHENKAGILPGLLGVFTEKILFPPTDTGIGYGMYVLASSL